eukprot:410491_1
MTLEQTEHKNDNNELFHPIFVTFGQTNSGKTHSIIGNVDESSENALNGILIQFVSKLFILFEKELKTECNIKICCLEEYGESLNTLKLYDLFVKFKNENPKNLFEEVIGSPPSKSVNSRPTFINIENINHLKTLITDGCETIHCGLFDNKII